MHWFKCRQEKSMSFIKVFLFNKQSQKVILCVGEVWGKPAVQDAPQKYFLATVYKKGAFLKIKSL